MVCCILIAQGLSADEAMDLVIAKRPAADPRAFWIEPRIRKFERRWREGRVVLRSERAGAREEPCASVSVITAGSRGTAPDLGTSLSSDSRRDVCLANRGERRSEGGAQAPAMTPPSIVTSSTATGCRFSCPPTAQLRDRCLDQVLADEDHRQDSQRRRNTTRAQRDQHGERAGDDGTEVGDVGEHERHDGDRPDERDVEYEQTGHDDDGVHRRHDRLTLEVAAKRVGPVVDDADADGRSGDRDASPPTLKARRSP